MAALPTVILNLSSTAADPNVGMSFSSAVQGNHSYVSKLNVVAILFKKLDEDDRQ